MLALCTFNPRRSGHYILALVCDPACLLLPPLPFTPKRAHLPIPPLPHPPPRYDTRKDRKFEKDAPVIGLVLQRSHLVTGDEGHYAGVVSELEARGAKVVPVFAGERCPEPRILWVGGETVAVRWALLALSFT